MIVPITTLVLLSERQAGIGEGAIWIYVWLNVALFFFPALIGLGTSYVLIRLRRSWRATLAAWSLILFFPIYFGVFYELVERTGFLFPYYSLLTSSGSFGLLVIGIQLAVALVAWLIGYDWLRGERRKLLNEDKRALLA
jgi:hypothetical protein